jgi:hypothetical protein
MVFAPAWIICQAFTPKPKCYEKIMPQLQAMQLDNGITIFIEANEDVNAPVISPLEAETIRISRGIEQTTQQAIQNFANLQNTIKGFAVYTLNSFKEISNANVDKVILEFGVNIGGEAGIPYITKGSIGSNLKITVECSFKQTDIN